MATNTKKISTKSEDRNIFDNIHNIKNKQWLDNAPVYVLMNILSQCDNELQILLLNELVNTKVFKLYNHNLLLQQLLQQCIYTTKTKFVNKTKKQDVLSIVAKYHNCSTREVKNIIHLFTDADIEYMEKELYGDF